MRIVHLYPFVPAARHGGTLRLAAALAGTAAAAQPELHYFDPDRGVWEGPRPPELVRGTPDGVSRAVPVKRRLFPSTLWESGRRARSALVGDTDRLALDASCTLLLHTTYLAPLLGSLEDRPQRSVIDAYDLVWRAHANDAAAAAGPLRALRAAYAAAVRRRECRALARADRILVAGHEDARLVRADLGRGEWLPTSTPVQPVEPRPASATRLRVGMLGNFAHESTRAGLRLLARSPLAAETRVTIVLAGLGSDHLPQTPGVQVLGPVDRAEDFYREVDCVVAPVVGGSGMKVKLAEAVLAGRPVVTTPMGALGYPTSVSRLFTVAPPDRLEGSVVERALREFDRAAARPTVERELGWERVTAGYAAAVA